MSISAPNTSIHIMDVYIEPIMYFSKWLFMYILDR